jgi:vitamin B12 transporter
VCTKFSAYGSTCATCTLITINANNKFSNTWKLKLSLVQTKSKRNSGTNATTIGDKYKETTITALNDIKIDDALLNVGLSQVKSENTTNKLKHTSQDLFINWQKNINDLDINAGLRYIKHNKFGNHTVYNVGFGKELGNGIRLTSNYNTAFQAPTLKEVTSGTQINDLKPETSKNINIGLNKNHTWGEVSLSLFRKSCINI